MVSFEHYLLKEFEEGKIDFHLRVHVEGEGHPVFYIHPQGKDGTTLDYIVLNNCLLARQTFADPGVV